MEPRPVQRPHPKIWVGGNSRRAIRRAVELGDGWLQLLNLTLRCGTLKGTSEGDRLAEVLKTHPGSSAVGS